MSECYVFRVVFNVSAASLKPSQALFSIQAASRIFFWVVLFSVQPRKEVLPLYHFFCLYSSFIDLLFLFLILFIQKEEEKKIFTRLLVSIKSVAMMPVGVPVE